MCSAKLNERCDIEYSRFICYIPLCIHKLAPFKEKNVCQLQLINENNSELCGLNSDDRSCVFGFHGQDTDPKNCSGFNATYNNTSNTSNSTLSFMMKESDELFIECIDAHDSAANDTIKDPGMWLCA